MTRYALCFVMLCTVSAWPQASGNVTMSLWSGAPTGTCNALRQLAQNTATGDLYTCPTTAAWHLTGSGGTTTLNGCTNTTPGQFVCTNSITGGTGPVGQLTLPFAGTGLPSPPTTAIASVAADATGHLWWSPGSGTAYVQILTQGTSTTTGAANALTFGSLTFPLTSTTTLIPTAGQFLQYNGTQIVGAVPAGVQVGGVTTIP